MPLSVTAQSTRSLRQHEQRDINHLEAGGFVVAHEAYADALLPASEGAAAWGEAFRVSGFERITVFVDYTHGDHTSVHIAVQTSGKSTGPTWYTLHIDEAGDGVLVEKEYTKTIAVDGSFAFEIPTQGAAMRLKVWGEGGVGTNDRATVRIARLMNAS